MIQELAQQEGVEVLTTEMPQERATTEVGEASTLQDLPRNLPSSDPQPGKGGINALNILLFLVMVNVLVICREC